MLALAAALAAAPGPILDASSAVAPCARPTGVYRDQTPWAQRLLDPARAWPLTTGAGVVVAVVGTGVDAGHPQFRPGQVLAGTDVLANGTANTDCDGRGTFAAGILAARPHPSTTFTGVAPGATILPIRYTQTTEQGANDVHPDQLAEAVEVAVDAGARVICVLAPAEVDSAALRAAVGAAQQADVVVVSPATAKQGGLVSHPTGHPAVLGVAAVKPDGQPVTTEAGGHIDVAGPGAGLVSTAPGARGQPGHIWPVDDPAFAAAYVAGAVALVRAYRPRLSAAQVLTRMTRTTSRPAANRDPRTGFGIVNPAAAVAAEIPDEAGAASPRRAPVSGDAIQPARPAVEDTSARRARAGVALGGMLLAALVAIGAAVIRRGRKRGWQPGLRDLDRPSGNSS